MKLSDIGKCGLKPLVLPNTLEQVLCPFQRNQQEASNTVQQRSASEGLSSISMVLETSPVMARYGPSLLAFVWFLDSTLAR